MNRFRRSIASVGLGLSLLAGLVAGVASTAQPANASTSVANLGTVDGHKTSINTYGLQTAYNPKSAAHNGSTDVYHCSLINPHVSSSRYIVASEFMPGAPKEVHHAIYFLIEPDHVAKAEALNASGNGHGWGCFGAPLNPTGSFDGTPWLGGWAPGATLSVLPKGVGILVPKGSMIVMQIHYNLLRGTAPDNSKVRLVTIPAAGTNLKAMEIAQYIAPPDYPCAAGITGPLCDRNAAVANLIARTGPQAGSFLSTIENFCKPTHDFNNLQTDGPLVSTTCAWHVSQTMHVVGISPHMHLTGISQVVTLTHDGQTTTLVNEPHYNFDHQYSHKVPANTVAVPGDTFTVTCTYDPRLRQRNPQLRQLPPRYVVWGDGSSDEMCLADVGYTAN